MSQYCFAVNGQGLCPEFEQAKPNLIPNLGLALSLLLVIQPQQIGRGTNETVSHMCVVAILTSWGWKSCYQPKEADDKILMKFISHRIEHLYSSEDLAGVISTFSFAIREILSMNGFENVLCHRTIIIAF